MTRVWRLLPILLDGRITYTNANVDAALKDSSVKPWTKLDLTVPSADDIQDITS